MILLERLQRVRSELRRWRAISAAIETLLPRERAIVEGLENGQKLKELAKSNSVTQARARQLANCAYEKLAEILLGLPEYVDKV